jgi:hypothetical protein
MIIGRNSKDFDLLLTTSDGVTTSLEITSISTTKVITSKGMISKDVPPLIGLMSLVVPTNCSLCLDLKVNDIAHVALVLVPISTNTK